MVYLLEDDPAIRELVAYSLSKSGIPTKAFGTPPEFWAALGAELPELVLLDVMLPGEDGLTVLGKLRAAAPTKRLPVIMLTAKGTEFDKVTALDGGADDYITKPFGVMELVSRVRAVLRRASDARENASAGEYTVGELSVSAARHCVTVGGEEVALTLKEFELLVLLLEHRGSVLNRDQILREVWLEDFDGENRTVDVHIRTLRRKLGVCGALVETVRGVGYRIGGKPA